ncbi:hypothetical protein BH20ACT2_BH20ACT2_04580 [soil metagenome]
MGLRDLKRRLTTSVEELDQARLQERYQGLGLTSIAEAPLRRPVRVGGEVQGIQVVPRAGAPSMEVTVDDGTGRAVAVFTGRRHIGGLGPGSGLLLEGVAGPDHRRIVLMNPAYTLLA